MFDKHIKPESSDKYDFLDGMIRIGMETLGRVIVAAAEKSTWKVVGLHPEVHESRTWEGTGVGSFRFVVTDFDLGSQGFPGHRAADGMVAVPDYGAIRLGHSFSARCVELARKQNPSV